MPRVVGEVANGLMLKVIWKIELLLVLKPSTTVPVAGVVATAAPNATESVKAVIVAPKAEVAATAAVSIVRAKNLFMVVFLPPNQENS
jgi:hypothetical protein